MKIKRINETNITKMFLYLSPNSKTTDYVIDLTTEYNVDIDLDRVIYRRGRFNFIDATTFPNLKVDFRTLNSDIENLFTQYNSINKYPDIFISKIDALKAAKNLNIKFPLTLIAHSWEQVTSKISGKIITKHFNETSTKILYKKTLFRCSKGTVIVDKNNAPRKFSPSLFQEYIEKKYEIRSFYFKGSFKSMAIFSQQNEKTKIDFRNYDHSRPNRYVPYNLPREIENKLHKLMLALNLNCGSIDLIISPDGDYYFLEVNPVGQYQWVSKYCNYFLERMIVQNLR